MKDDVAIIGAGPGGIFSAYELTKLVPSLRVAVLKPATALKAPLPHRRQEGQKLHRLQSCSIARRLRRRGRVLDGK